MRWSRRAVLSAMVSFALGGCLSPTLPLPPPGEPTVEQVGQNQFRLTGRVPGPGWVVALNMRTEVLAGDLTDDGGNYSFVVTARRDDPMSLWYSADGELSSPVEFEIGELTEPVGDAGAPPADAGSSSGDGGAP